ncbi:MULTISPECIES: hypothetical protein [Cyanophyceae]|uniref:hypothetical protein n=1 Tax=Cyanophyceae TaxID=3028117 RepID=UPI00168954D2|nr:hypothetical protein [Trichocoleus sp. FACHB-40]MBD2005546.1 hypothetical protein [Trichocoleus sp. FACHB-40]
MVDQGNPPVLYFLVAGIINAIAILANPKMRSQLSETHPAKQDFGMMDSIFPMVQQDLSV